MIPLAYLRYIMVLGSLVLFSYTGIAANNVDRVTPTNEFVDFYGMNTNVDGELIPIGSVIIATDSNGTICGSFTVETLGEYGLMHVYRDNPLTPVDEGANPGDTIDFEIEGIPAEVEDGESSWSWNGDSKRVELTATTVEKQVLPNSKNKGSASSGNNVIMEKETVKIQVEESDEEVILKKDNIRSLDLTNLSERQVKKVQDTGSTPERESLQPPPEISHTDLSKSPKKTVGLLIVGCFVILGLLYIFAMKLHTK